MATYKEEAIEAVATYRCTDRRGLAGVPQAHRRALMNEARALVEAVEPFIREAARKEIEDRLNAAMYINEGDDPGWEESGMKTRPPELESRAVGPWEEGRFGTGKKPLPEASIPRLTADEFTAAQQNPKAHQAIREAVAEGERLEAAPRCGGGGILHDCTCRPGLDGGGWYHAHDCKGKVCPGCPDCKPEPESVDGEERSVTDRLERASVVEEALREETELFDAAGDRIENFDWIVAVALSALAASPDTQDKQEDR
jgi:hypothetical protein